MLCRTTCRAKDHKARNRYTSAIISMSIAGPRSAALNDAVEAAVAAGITVVTAAGGSGAKGAPMSRSRFLLTGPVVYYRAHVGRMLQQPTPSLLSRDWSAVLGLCRVSAIAKNASRQDATQQLLTNESCVRRACA